MSDSDCLPSICPTASFHSFSLSFSFSLGSVSIPTPRSRLLGFLAEHRDRRKREKKKKQKVESMKDILVEVCNLLLLCKLPTRCAYTQSSAVALTPAQQGCDRDTQYCRSVTTVRDTALLSLNHFTVPVHFRHERVPVAQS